jgi:hypothetical protein
MQKKQSPSLQECVLRKIFDGILQNIYVDILSKTASIFVNGPCQICYHIVKKCNCYCLVWATELLLAAIGLVFPVLVLGYNSFNCSMYQVPVPTLIEKFV